MKKVKWIPIIGLSFVFIYFGIDKFVHPQLWMSWIPPFMDGLLGISKANWNSIIAVSEIIMSVVLLMPKTRRLGALLMSLHLIAIVFMTFPSDIAIRDIGLLSIAAYYLFSHE
jgi:uncharacterized membrane protein